MSLQVRQQYGNWEFLYNSVVVAKTSKNAKKYIPKGDFQAIIAELVVRYRAEENDQYLYRYPEGIEKWTVVVPQLIIPGK